MGAECEYKALAGGQNMSGRRLFVRPTSAFLVLLKGDELNWPQALPSRNWKASEDFSCP
jgi:hypothetical protein